MKTIDDYIKLPYRMELVEDIDEGGYVVTYPDLKGCITCGDTIEAAITNAKEAKVLWLKAALEEGCEIPEPDDPEKYSDQFNRKEEFDLLKALAEAQDDVDNGRTVSIEDTFQDISESLLIP